jgi:hypothetical protein
MTDEKDSRRYKRSSSVILIEAKLTLCISLLRFAQHDRVIIEMSSRGSCIKLAV